MNLLGMTPLLQVYDMRLSVAFYRDRLGFSVVSTSEPGDEYDWAMLKRDDITLMLNTAYEREERPAAPDPARVQAHADTTLYFSTDNVEDTRAHLLQHGWNCGQPVITHYGMKQLYTRDPDGYQICFQHPV